MKTIYLISLNDGTDEIYNIGSHVLEIKDGETARDAWEALLLEEFECWSPEDWEDDEGERTPLEMFREYMDFKFYLPVLFDPERIIELQSGPETFLLIEDEQFGSLESALDVAQGMADAL